MPKLAERVQTCSNYWRSSGNSSQADGLKLRPAAPVSSMDGGNRRMRSSDSKVDEDYLWTTRTSERHPERPASRDHPGDSNQPDLWTIAPDMAAAAENGLLVT